MKNKQQENNKLVDKGYLHEGDRQELYESGIDDEHIKLNEIQTITVDKATKVGFYAISKTEEKEPLLQGKYVSHCLYFPFFDKDGNQITDDKTGASIGVIKPRWTELAKQTFSDLPKYLCQTKKSQSRMYLHFPKSPKVDWNELFKNKEDTQVCLTEGFKKALKACREGIPCIAVWSVWCFSEGQLDNSPLIPELKELFEKSNFDISLVFDSDKYTKPAVAKAEQTFANKVMAETGKTIKRINLPQRFEGKQTKGLDDFLCIAGKEQFLKLKPEKISNIYISSYKTSTDRPEAPLGSMPEVFIDAVYDISEKLEGSLEIAAGSLIASVIGPCYNVISCHDQHLNLYLAGLAPTTAGKTAIARACFKPASTLDAELLQGYYDELKSYEANPKSNDEQKEVGTLSFLASTFTREGLTFALSSYFKLPSAVFFEAEEFDILLKKMGQDYNSSLASFITKIYDCVTLNNDFTKSNFTANQIKNTIQNPTLSIFGISNEKSYFENLPKNALESGFLARFAHILGKKRDKVISKPGQLDIKIRSRIKSILVTINDQSQKLAAEGKTFNFVFNEDIASEWDAKYLAIKKLIDSEPESLANPSIYRDGNSIFKLAGIFELVLRASDILEGNRKDLLDDPCISPLAYYMASDWVDYFIQTDIYIFNNYLTKEVNSFHSLSVKIINLLKEYPNGLLWSDLKIKVNLHRSKKQTELFKSLIKELKNEGSIELVKAKGEIIKLREHLISQ